MNDARRPGSPADDRRRQLTLLFLQRTLEDVEQMRRDVPQLISGDPATWEELRFAAQRAAGHAQQLGLGPLRARALDLAGMAEEKFAGVALDAHFLLAVTTALEEVAIEVNRQLAEMS